MGGGDRRGRKELVYFVVVVDEYVLWRVDVCNGSCVPAQQPLPSLPRTSDQRNLHLGHDVVPQQRVGHLVLADVPHELHGLWADVAKQRHDEWFCNVASLGLLRSVQSHLVPVRPVEPR